MGKVIVSNNVEWIEELSKSLQDVGLKKSFLLNRYANILSFHKYRINNCNCYVSSSGDFITTSGTLIYNGLFEEEALQMLLEDLKIYSINEVRKNIMGNYCVVYSKGEDIFAFVDETGTYSIYYYNDERFFLFTNTFYHVEKCVSQSSLGYEYLEQVLFPGIFGNKSPFKNIYRLMGNEVIHIRNNIFEIGDVELNRYQLNSNEFDESVKQIAEAFNKYASFRKVIPYECVIFLTGGIDSRLVLSSMLSSGQKVSIGNWQGCPIDMNNKIEDREISRIVAKKMNLKMVEYDITHDLIYDMNHLDIELYERYGEYAAIYGSNKKWFDIFEKGEYIHWEFGHLGEAFRDVLDDIYHDNYSLDNYYNDYLRRHCSDFAFIGSKGFTIEELHQIVKTKIRIYCENEGINCSDLSKNDCQAIFNYMQLHSEMIKANLYNMIGYYTNLYSQKEIYDYSITVNYDYKNEKKLILSMIDYLMPELNTISYFTRCNHMIYHPQRKTLHPTSKIALKTMIKSSLLRTDIGKKIVRARANKLLSERYKHNEELMNEYIKRISNSEIIKQMRIGITKDSFEYIPNYAFLNASDFYMDMFL